jgi:hypothetical protein
VRTLFVRAFTEGLHDPSARVLETEWRTALRAVTDATLACANCGFEHVADYRRSGLVCLETCIACGAPLDCPPVLLVNHRAILLDQGREIHQSALDRSASRTRAACVEAHPSRQELIGLRNCTEAAWRVTLPDGNEHSIAAGQAVRIIPGSTIRFGRAIGQIVDPSAAGQRK